MLKCLGKFYFSYSDLSVISKLGNYLRCRPNIVSDAYCRLTFLLSFRCFFNPQSNSNLFSLLLNFEFERDAVILLTCQMTSS